MVQISFVEKNQDWNNRTAIMNHEVWFMLLGYNFDFWTPYLVGKAISPFGKLVIWEEDHLHTSRILGKAHIFSLDCIPWFFLLTKGDGFETDSWTVQCEILQARMLGGQVQDVDFPLDDTHDLQPNQFDFFGFW